MSEYKQFETEKSSECKPDGNTPSCGYERIGNCLMIFFNGSGSTISKLYIPISKINSIKETTNNTVVISYGKNMEVTQKCTCPEESERLMTCLQKLFV